jgi:hypothetical protein
MADARHTSRAYDWANGQHVAYDASTQSAALDAHTEYAISPSTDCYITVGANPTATIGADSLFVPKGAIFHFWNEVAGDEIAVIKHTSAGTLSIIPAL